MFPANNSVTCSYSLLFNFIWWHHASGWKQLIHAAHPHMVYGWIYISSRFVCINIAFCPCYLFLKWNVVSKCSPCSLPHNHYCCSLPSPVCLPHLCMPQFFIDCLPTIIRVMLMSLVFFVCSFVCLLSVFSFLGLLMVHCFLCRL